MEARRVTIPADIDQTRKIEIYTASGVVRNTLYIEFVQSRPGSYNFIEGWYTREALDDLITVLQFAKLERFGND